MTCLLSAHTFYHACHEFYIFPPLTAIAHFSMPVTGDRFFLGCAAGCMFSHNLEQRQLKTFLNDTRLQLTFCILRQWFDPNFWTDRLYKRKTPINSKRNLVAFQVDLSHEKRLCLSFLLCIEYIIYHTDKLIPLFVTF